MNLTGRITPSKTISALMIVFGVGFMVLGVTVLIPEAGLFGWFWTLGALTVTGYHFFNLVFAEGVAEEVFDASSSSHDLSGGLVKYSVEERLQRLKDLKRTRLIDQKEYEQQRQRILNDI